MPIGGVERLRPPGSPLKMSGTVGATLKMLTRDSYCEFSEYVEQFYKVVGGRSLDPRCSRLRPAGALRMPRNPRPAGAPSRDPEQISGTCERAGDNGPLCLPLPGFTPSLGASGVAPPPALLEQARPRIPQRQVGGPADPAAGLMGPAGLLCRAGRRSRGKS